jgi:hypothetical protein
MLVRTSAILLLIAVVTGALGIPSRCSAQVQLPTVNLGLTNFEDGFATPGWFLQEFPDYYNADKLKDSQGITVPGRNELTGSIRPQMRSKQSQAWVRRKSRRVLTSRST